VRSREKRELEKWERIGKKKKKKKKKKK